MVGGVEFKIKWFFNTHNCSAVSDEVLDVVTTHSAAAVVLSEDHQQYPECIVAPRMNIRGSN